MEQCQKDTYLSFHISSFASLMCLMMNVVSSSNFRPYEHRLRISVRRLTAVDDLRTKRLDFVHLKMNLPLINGIMVGVSPKVDKLI